MVIIPCMYVEAQPPRAYVFEAECFKNPEGFTAYDRYKKELKTNLSSNDEDCMAYGTMAAIKTN